MVAMRRRTVTSKPSKGGCLTCRIRKVKCDEARPQCRRCTSTGRNCDGYQSPEPGRTAANRQLMPSYGNSDTTSMVLQPRGGSPDIQATALEQHAFDYFRLRGAGVLWISTPAKEWIRLVIQIATHEPAVFYAVTAFAVEQESRYAPNMYRTLEHPSEGNNKEVAIQQLCKATSALGKYIDGALRNNATVEPVLACSLMFLAFDVMLGKFESAASHLHFGQRILDGELRSTADPKTTQRNHLKYTSAGCLAAMKTTFRILGHDFLDLHGYDANIDEDSRARSPNPSLNLPHAFTSLGQAKQCLNTLSLQSNQLRQELVSLAEDHLLASGAHTIFTPAVRLCMAHCLSRTVSTVSSASTQTRLRNLQSAYDSWLSALTAMERQKHNVSSNSLVVLKLQHMFASLSCKTLTEIKETVWDSFTEDFVQALDRADIFLRPIGPIPAETVHEVPPGPYEPQRSFSLEPGVLPALSLISFKCRNSEIRHRAISLLHYARRREGLLWSENIAYFSHSIADIEEAQARSLLSTKNGQDPAPAVDARLRTDQVPEAVRFLDIIVSGETPHSTRIICGRLAHERKGELEIEEYMGYGYPMDFQHVGSTITGYRC